MDYNHYINKGLKTKYLNYIVSQNKTQIKQDISAICFQSPIFSNSTVLVALQSSPVTVKRIYPLY